jgi:small subunit ribosomal protein S1
MLSDDSRGAAPGSGTVPSTMEEQPVSSTLEEQVATSAVEEQAATGGLEHEEAAHEAIDSAVPEVQIEFPPAEASAPESGAAETSELDHLMMADMQKVASLPTGEIVPGKILKIADAEVFVDVGLKTEAAVPISEFQTEDGTVSVQPGDTVDVWIERLNEKEGTVTVSRRKAARLRFWEQIERAYQEQTNLTGRVVERVKGGLAVDIGMKAFMPSSHADLRPLHNPDSLIGQEIPVKVIKYARKRSNVVVSRKLALEEEASRRKEALLERLEEGVVLEGRVKNLTDYGAFVDLGGMDGLLHVTDMAWHRIKHPSDVVAAGQEIRVKVLKFDAEKGRVSLGLKQLSPDPWERVAERYHPGDRARGRVVSLTDYGAFVELEPGIEGMIHVSEMTWSKRLKHPSKILNRGDEVEVAVLDVKPAERRLSLSLRETLPNPWTSFAEKYTVGSEAAAIVRNLTDFGAFAEIEPGVEGLIHVSDLSWTKKVRHPSEVLKKGQQIKAVILRLDIENRRLSLGLKQLETDPWEIFLNRIKVGELVHGKVARLAAFGAFVELAEGVEGLCHNSETNGGAAGKKKVALEVGQEYDFRVIRLNATEKKIGLSLKDVSRPAAPPPEPRKQPELKTTMAEAFSSAGITATPAPSPLPAEQPEGTAESKGQPSPVEE